jgi:hypothetical protein
LKLLLAMLVRFNEGLLRQQSSGRNTLISRLVAVIQVGGFVTSDLCYVLASFAVFVNYRIVIVVGVQDVLAKRCYWRCWCASMKGCCGSRATARTASSADWRL